MSELWTEKYRPTKLSDIIGQTNFVLDAEHWVANKEMPNILLYGVAGVGKTAAAISLANGILENNRKNNFFEINASDDRKLETVRNRIKEIASTKRIGDVPFKIILLDEMDGMTKDAQNALKRIMERYSDNCRFIITCNDRHKIINPLMSRCANYNFKRLNNKDMKYIMSEILSKENINTHSEEELDKFITYLQGDLRRGLNELQASSASKRTLQYQIDMNMKPYSEIITMINENNYENALEKVHKLIYDSTDMKTICINLHTTVLETESDSNYKFKMLRIIGETEWRSNNMNPKVLASWMVGQMIK
jgi:replication factor C small subunit